MGKRARLVGVLLVAVTVVVAPGGPVYAHDERPVRLPDGSGEVPAYRADGPRILVCKTDRADLEQRVAGFADDLRRRNLELFDECQRSGVRHVQEAVDRAAPGTTILVLPGLYQEEPSLPDPSGSCASLDAPRAKLGHQVLSYEQQQRCPHNQNLVAVLGKRDLQIEGTGAKPEDVVLDAQYRKLNALRADRADGIYLRNFTAQRTTFNAVYILETDGFVIDRAVGRWNDEYGFLTFAVDHGLYTDCEAYGNGDSGVYPGSASDINANRGHDVPRYAVEIRRCRSHHNLLGYSGTAGDSVWAHDNDFYENSAGVSMDSAFPNHPGLPQNHAKFERNRIHANNVDYVRYVRDGTCAKPFAERGYEHGVVCPATGVPRGTGVLTAGGNFNAFRDNWVYGNDRTGFMLLWVPAFIRGDTALSRQADTSHHNRYEGNHLGITPDGARRPNGRDFWWDGQGAGNCWQDGGRRDGSDPVALPVCGGLLSSHRLLSDPTKLGKLYLCAGFDRESATVPATCDWYGASGPERFEIRVGAFLTVLLGALLVLLGWRLAGAGARRNLLGALTGTGLAGLVLGVWDRPLPTVGYLVLFGGALVGFGLLMRRHTARRGLAWLTLAMGVLALLDAVDRFVVMLPWLPVGPAWLRLLAGLCWVPWLAVVYRRPDPGTPITR